MRGGRFALMMRRPALPRFGADDVPMEKPPPEAGGGAWALNAKPGVASIMDGETGMYPLSIEVMKVCGGQPHCIAFSNHQLCLL